MTGEKLYERYRILLDTHGLQIGRSWHVLYASERVVWDELAKSMAGDDSEDMKLAITLPDEATHGDLLKAAGAIVAASTDFVDWEELRMYEQAPQGIDPAGRILLDLASQLTGRRES